MMSNPNSKPRKPVIAPDARDEAERSRMRRKNDPTFPLYNTQRWKKLRAKQLAAQPLCAMCQEEGLVVVANICDHVNPHRGDEHVFWSGPFQSLCQSHHSSDKQRMENGGKRRLRIGLDGWPV